MKFRLAENFFINSDEEPWRTEGLRICLFGGPGSGKSWNAQLIAEQFLQQGGTLVAFQPRDEYYTLKDKATDFTPYQIAIALSLGRKSSRFKEALRRLRKLELIEERFGRYKAK